MTHVEDELVPEHIRAAAFEWRVLLASGHPSAEELAAFEAWRRAHPTHADAYDRAVSVLGALGTLSQVDLEPGLYPNYIDPQDTPETGSIWAKIFGRKTWTVSGLLGGALVAALSFAFLPQLATDSPPQEQVLQTSEIYQTEIGDIQTFELSDGSEITLGAASELEIRFYDNQRSLVLKRGAALFEVAPDPDRPFSVMADSMTAAALGTIFSIRNNGGTVRLAVSEGRVSASHPLMLTDQPSSLSVRKELGAGEQIYATSQAGLSDVSNYRERNFAAWRDGRLTYVSGTLQELVADANRYSDRPIQLDSSLQSLEDLGVTVSFDAGDIPTMIEALPDMFPVQIDQSSEKEIVISARDVAN
ncbi:MAG: FecR domain-containing protein [Pseudomonadota bacterium]